MDIPLVVYCLFQQSSSLAKSLAHGLLSFHPWQIELDFLIPADRRPAVFICPDAYKDDITFDQWVFPAQSAKGVERGDSERNPWLGRCSAV